MLIRVRATETDQPGKVVFDEAVGPLVKGEKLRLIVRADGQEYIARSEEPLIRKAIDAGTLVITETLGKAAKL